MKKTKHQELENNQTLPPSKKPKLDLGETWQLPVIGLNPIPTTRLNVMHLVCDALCKAFNMASGDPPKKSRLLGLQQR